MNDENFAKEMNRLHQKKHRFNLLKYTTLDIMSTLGSKIFYIIKRLEGDYNKKVADFHENLYVLMSKEDKYIRDQHRMNSREERIENYRHGVLVKTQSSVKSLEVFNDIVSSVFN